ncbi:MAG: chaperonin GroEL [Clostridiales bacterium]|nr:chaperonin GroEL [Clostridiales bacterium]
MVDRIIVTGDEAKQKLLRGVERLSNAVKITLGPKGRNVVLERRGQTPMITNDGVTIAKEVELKDEIENMGAELIKSASIRTNDIAGDGTTTATILTENIFKEGLKCFNSGANPVLLKSGIGKAVNKVVETIESRKKEVKDNDSICQVATISSGSVEVGKIIAKAYEEVGLDGVITIEDGNNVLTSLNITEGLRINRGYISPYMCDDQVKFTAELENPYILITDKKISNIQEILPIIEKVANAGGSLFIVAEDIDGDALTTIVVNNMRKIFRCLAVKTPFFGDRRKKVLDDIALSVGGKFVSQDCYTSLKDLTLDDLGHADKIKADKDCCTIIGARGNKQEIEKRISELKNSFKLAKKEFDKETLLGRISNLNGGIAVIKAGANSEVEMKEKKLRIEDALNATQAAIDEGIVVGGGVALLKAKNSLKELIEELIGDEKLGAEIVSKTLEIPVRQIAKNAGIDDGVIVAKILENEDLNFGYDALNNKFCDMFESGIIDPVKVTRTALETAGSVASTLLTTECAIALNEESAYKNEMLYHK